MKAALARIEAQHEALLAALDGSDLAAIERASDDLATGLQAVEGVNALTAEPGLTVAAQRIRRLAEAGTMRVNVLADHTRRRAEALAMMRGRAMSATYSR